MDGMKNCLIGLSCISVDDRAREIELSRRMMKARNKQIDKGTVYKSKIGVICLSYLNKEQLK